MTITLIHLDTDIGSDPDDGCALAMLLGWPGVEITGITTVADPGGVRAGLVHEILRLAGRTDIPVAAGAERPLSARQEAWPVVDEALWPARPARPAPPGAALDLMARSIDRGATVVGIGPYTNLAMLAAGRAGSLAQAPVVLMGGWTGPPAAGLPPWGPARDANVQWDVRAAEAVTAEAADLTLVTLPATLQAHLRRADLARLHDSGRIGVLLADQSEAHAVATGKAALGPAHRALPDDLLNFHYDPVACAVAAGWDGVRTEDQRLRAVLDDGTLRFEPHPQGRPTRVVVDVDGAAFTAVWLAAVEAAQRRA
jgi:inosine-uridine nucleoside N-ribohydrolase